MTAGVDFSVVSALIERRYRAKKLVVTQTPFGRMLPVPAVIQEFYLSRPVWAAERRSLKTQEVWMETDHLTRELPRDSQLPHRPGAKTL